MENKTKLEIKIGDYIKVKRNSEEFVFEVYEIGNSYGGNKIFYDEEGGFCMEYENIEILDKEKVIEERKTLKEWFFSNRPKEEKPAKGFDEWVSICNKYNLLDEVMEMTKAFVNKGQSFETAFSNAMMEWDM